MARTKTKKGNPLASNLSIVESTARNYLVNERQILNNTERILRQNPSTRRELDRLGPLPQLLTQGEDENVERHYLSRFINAQTSIFIDRVTQGDILRTPSLETLLEQERENSQILISISTELESCCTEIKAKLDILSDLIKTQFRRLRDLLISNFSSLEAEGQETFEKLTSTILDNRQVVLLQFNRRFDTVETLINQINTFIQNKVTERSLWLENLLEGFSISVKRLILESVTKILESVEVAKTDLKTYLADSFEALLFNITSELSTQTGALVAAGKLFYNSTILPLLGTIATGVGEITLSTTYISTTVSQILVAVKSLPKSIEDLLTKQLDDLKDFLDEWKKDLIQEIAQEVSLQIVGESYYKWNSVSTYFPTLTFLFKEQKVSQKPRRSQIKLRLPKKNEELTSEDIKSLKSKCVTILNKTYRYGTQRYNYVSSDKRFKTTVFGQNSAEIKDLFKSIFEIIGEPFEVENLSITDQINRVNKTKRSVPLSTIEPNKINYQEDFKVEFYKAVLLVNGLESPIILAQR